MMKPSEALTIIANWFAEGNHWMQRGYYLPDGFSGIQVPPLHQLSKACVVGAVWSMASNHQVETRKYLERALGDSDLSSWNDYPCRKLSEVIDLCHAAARLAKEADQ